MISLEMVGYRDSKPGSQSYPVYVNATEYPDTGDFIAVVRNEPSTELTLQVTEGMRNSEPTLPVEQLIVPGSGIDFTEVRLSDHSPSCGTSWTKTTLLLCPPLQLFFHYSA